MTIVDKTNKEELEILTVRTREDILRLLYDKIPRSPYRIAKELHKNTATIIKHLDQLEDKKLVKSEKDTKTLLRKKLYEITEKGKKILLTFLKFYMDDINENKEIAKEVANFLGKV